MNIVITVIVLIVMLGILISTHEAGHLWAAKRFGVYCFEYSIGFGPALVSTRLWTRPIIKTKKAKGWNEPSEASEIPSKGETAVSLRLIPLGGYVSMYGEEMDETPSGIKVPFRRSLKGIKNWKKAIIMAAGIGVNLVTSFIFVFIYAVAFPTLKAYERFDTGVKDASGASVALYSLRCEGQIGTTTINPETQMIYSPVVAAVDNNESGFIIDCDTIINGEHMVMTYVPNQTTSTPFKDTVRFFYPAGGFVPTAERLEYGLTAAPDGGRRYQVKDTDDIIMHFTIVDETVKEEQRYAERTVINLPIRGSDIQGMTLNIKTLSFYYSFGESVEMACYYYASFFKMIGQGLGQLFTFNFSNIGGIISMGSGINQLSSYMGFGRTFFYYGGFLALNLAIFNLLPFPGLDGWQLFVTAFESITKKEIPQKAKAIMSYVGLALLFGLAIFITVKDIVRLV